MLTALGAGRSRLVPKALTESVILSLAGGALGVALAHVGIEALVRAYPASLPRIGEVAVDQRVMLVSLAIAFACGVLFGLAPLTHGRSDTVAEALKSGSPGSSGAPAIASAACSSPPKQRLPSSLSLARGCCCARFRT